MTKTQLNGTDTPRGNRKEPRDAILRQWTMLKLIPQKPASITTQQVQSRLADVDQLFAVHKRTVERNLLSLMSVFPTLDFNVTAAGYCWFWDPESAANDCNSPVETMIQAKAA